VFISANYTGTLVSQNVKKVYEYIKSTVRKVKQRMALKELCLKRHKIQSSFKLNGVNSLIRSTTIANSEYTDNIDWLTLLTTQVENLHAVSHFKHETFNALEYATDLAPYQKNLLSE